jgi:hypothetical protein
MTNTNLIQPRFLTASEYVLALHRPDDRVAILLRNRRREQTMQRILRAEEIADPTFQDWLRERNNGGADVFLGMNPLRPISIARTKQSILEIRHVYLDLDEDGPASLHAIRTSGDIPTPNFLLDTSPDKNQAVWRVSGIGPEQAESLLHGLAVQFRGDMAATDVSRVLRVPEFRNWKYDEPFAVRAVQETDATYELRDFLLQDDSPDTRRDRAYSDQTGLRMAPGHRSQSEADWAYAKRALARGDDPQEIIRRIADFRAEDKADPQYYARRTVTKAQAGANSVPSSLNPTTLPTQHRVPDERSNR